MAYRSYRGKRHYKRRWRRYGKRYFKKRFRRFINGSSKSICRLKVPMLVKTTLANVDDDGAVLSIPITPWATTLNDIGDSGNPYSALNSPIYRQFANLYDEVKCIGGKVNVSVETPIGTATIPSVTIVTAWDRRIGKEDRLLVPTYDDLITYSTAKRAVGINNSVCKIKRSLYASDLIEKAQWHDCTMKTELDGAFSDYAVLAAGDNPNFFTPGMWLGMAQSGSAAANLNLIIEINWYFAFRNPKYGGAAQLGGLKGDMRATAPMMDQDAEEGEDDTEVLDKEVAAAAPSAKRARFVS